MTIRILQGCCLEVMQTLTSASIDLILCDLPYGTTACAWDAVIPFAPLWAQYRRVAKPSAAIVLTSSQPFTTALISSNLSAFKYVWHWDKVNGIRNHLNAKKQPMRKVEDVCVFYEKQCTYNPQMRPGGYTSRKTKPGQSDGFGKVSGVDTGRKVEGLYPVDLLQIESHDPNNSVHPTQKPVALMDYLIRTYSNPGDLILDNCAGSGTTGVAAVRAGRRCILIEREPKYIDTARRRVDDELGVFA
jgi:site-specific DNA-methyltransferase (adenine-specific)